MDLKELLDVVWRRKAVVGIVALATVGLAILALQLVDPVYESKSTLVLSSSADAADDFSFFFALESIVPVYANAATTRATRRLAEERLGSDLAEISVETFEGTPIIEIKARDPDPEKARASADAVSDALLAQVARGDVGVESLEIDQIDQPTVPTEAVFPQTGLTLAVAAVLGLAFGLAAAFIRESLTSRVETSHALAELTGVPVYGEIRTAKGVDKLRSPEQLTSNARFRGLLESMRDLRTNLRFAENGHRSVVITSPEGRHGKTTIAFGLAVTFARAGTRTILVDGDLRRGRIAEMLKLPRAPGLLDALRGAPLHTVIRRSTMENLDILTGGKLVEDPGELLLTQFANVLRQLEEMYDVVVLDTTPLVPVNDARVMASFAETTVIVASAEATKRRQVREAVERLTLVSVQPTAVVLNRSKSPRGDYYYSA
ncbi:MAG TPA: polysaccharide biosynthesis tyrosine autokinase [Gaiellaceae bacterium]|nr:polysaccharide biosynthesis tyrosine autokinase [Gaiellaceae bacterium]